MRELLSKARARVIRHLVLDKGALALAIGMGGLILLLLIGTEILDWYWPVLLAAVSLGVGIYQLRKHVPTRYQLAQRIDDKMALADSLSTAVYFSEHPPAGREAVCAVQYGVAEGLARSVSLEQALPMARSRYLLPAIGLLAVASGLFIARYVWIGSLDLHSSLLEMAVDTFFTSPAEVAAAKTPKGFQPRPFDPTQPGAPPEDVQQAIPPDAEKGKQLLESPQDQDSNGEKSADEGEKGDSQDSKDGAPQDKSDKQEKPSEREGADKGQNDSQGQDKRSLLDKLRDAAQNIMNKVSSSEQKQQSAKGKEKGQKSDKSGKGDDDGKQDQNSEADAQPNSDDPGGKGKPGSKQAESKAQDADKGASGSGDNEGKKAVEEAKAEEAMGKVRELLTQRSASISGDMMVEVGETKQQLKTAMTQQKAGHSDSGGEIHRDQVPLADQTFVERYFQEIRKPGKTPAIDSKGKTN